MSSTEPLALLKKKKNFNALGILWVEMATKSLFWLKMQGNIKALKSDLRMILSVLKIVLSPWVRKKVALSGRSSLFSIFILTRDLIPKALTKISEHV